MEWTDAEAAAEARWGTSTPFECWWSGTLRAIFRLAYLMTSNEQDAEDLVQETFLRSYKQMPQLRWPGGIWKLAAPDMRQLLDST